MRKRLLVLFAPLACLTVLAAGAALAQEGSSVDRPTGGYPSRRWAMRTTPKTSNANMPSSRKPRGVSSK